MNELRVEHGGDHLTLQTDEVLGIGRTNLERPRQVGWGRPGRFIEIGAASYIHRVWCDVVWQRSLWCVRSLGASHPTRVVLGSGVVIELAPWTAESRSLDEAPDVLAISDAVFEIVLAVGDLDERVKCSWFPDSPGVPGAAVTGTPTTSLGQELVHAMTKREFQVLAVMSMEFRQQGPRAGAVPKVLSYSRIRRRLDLQTERQAISAVERLVRKFREAGLVPATTPADMQRQRVCEAAIAHGVLDALEHRYGLEVA